MFYAYAGAAPASSPGGAPHYQTRGRPTLGLAGFAYWIGEMLAADAPVDAICPSGRAPGDTDPVCTYALEKPACAPEGSASCAAR